MTNVTVTKIHYDALTKACFICKQERSEKYFLTDTREVHIGNWEMSRTTRYCNDNPECEKATKEKKWLLERIFSKKRNQKDDTNSS